jgi:hypothetical protein
MQTSASHDARVVKALQAGKIRLLSCEWLRAREADWKMKRMQDLDTDAFLTADEAATSFADKTRRVAALSYGTRRHPPLSTCASAPSSMSPPA